jgi:hypothetical protein
MSHLIVALASICHCHRLVNNECFISFYIYFPLLVRIPNPFSNAFEQARDLVNIAISSVASSVFDSLMAFGS